MFDLSKIKSSFKRKLFRSPEVPRASGSPTEDLKSQVALRFFLKKSKRFSLLSKVLHQKMQDATNKINRANKSFPECLLYLGLAPRNQKLKESSEKRKLLENRRDDFEFTKPKIYECDYCTKIFFHKVLYRRHMIRHLKKIQWCCKCNRGFTSKVAKKKHQVICRR